MGHPHIDNRTPFAFEPIFAADEELRPVVTTVVKATYQFDVSGRLRLADEQTPVNLAGEPSTDAPLASFKYEPEVALSKLSTDVVLIGHALPPANGAPHVDVGIKVGTVQKLARVFGERFWLWTSDGVRMSRPAAIQDVPLTWENAFGGRDPVRSTPDKPLLDPRNPVGTGFGMPLEKDGDFLRLPNIEDPQQLITDYGQVVTPTGFGFTSPNWHPRSQFAGTYDEEWNATRKPLLPVDFDRRFFNAAAPGLIAPGYLRGNEDVVILNAAQEPRVAFQLPGLPSPKCRVVLRGKKDLPLQTNLDTVIVNGDERRLLLLWRAGVAVGGGPQDVTDIVITC